MPNQPTPARRAHLRSRLDLAVRPTEVAKPTMFGLPKHMGFGDVLKRHGYKHVGSTDGTGGEEDLYEHPDGHTASHWLGSGEHEKPHHRMPETVFHTHAQHAKDPNYGGEHDTEHGTPGSLHRHLSKIHGKKV
jgi:hypothetical protein